MNRLIASANITNEHSYRGLIASLAQKLAALEARSDAAAQFARAELTTRKEKAQARLDAYHVALPECEAARAEYEAALLQLEEKRTELLRELNKAFEPFARREFEARQAHEAAVVRATLDSYESLWVGNDPGDTDLIAHRVATDHNGGLHVTVAETVMNQRNIPAVEMACAIVAESHHLDPEAQEAFAQRWLLWAGAHGIDPGHKPVSEAKPHNARPKQISRTVRPRKVSVG